MRSSFVLPLMLLATVAQAEPSKPAAFERVFELAGIRLLCEQSGPLVTRGLPEEKQPPVAEAFDADSFCIDLASRLAPAFTAEQVEQATKVLESPLAQRFTVAERAVGEGDGGAALATYREQVRSKPPRAARVELVRRLDAAAHTTELSTLLRYEVGKTQALLALREKKQNLTEAELAKQTEQQLTPLRMSSAEAVETFMLYAYRQMPSGELADYAALYEQRPVNELLAAAVKELPAVFAARRAVLK